MYQLTRSIRATPLQSVKSMAVSATVVERERLIHLIKLLGFFPQEERQQTVP